MKKLTLILALVLCLALCVFAFASCGKSGKDDAKTESDSASATSASTGSTTAHEHVAGAEKEIDLYPSCTSLGSKSFHCTVCHQPIPGTEEKIPMLPHVPEAEFTIIPATCIHTGTRYKLCEICGNIVDSTVEELPVDENAHKVDVWSATPTLLNPSVQATGECTICHQPVEKDRTFAPNVWVVDDTEEQNYFLCASYEDEILAEGDRFYPDELNGYEGNDLWIEFSILWNEAFANNCKGTLWSGNSRAGGTKHVKWLWMSMNNGGDGRSDSPYAGAFEVNDLGTVEYPVGVSMAGSGSDFDQFPNIAGPDQANPEYGWHRVAIKVHQDVTNAAALEADESAGATKAQYKLTATYYIDGVKLVQLSYSGNGETNGGWWYSGEKANANMQKGLFSAESDGEGNVVYKNLWEMDDDGARSTHAFVGVVGAKAADDATTPGYVIIGDVSFTCGKAPVQNVKRVDSPSAATYEIAEGVNIPAPVYFQFAD